MFRNCSIARWAARAPSLIAFGHHAQALVILDLKLLIDAFLHTFVAPQLLHRLNHMLLELMGPLVDLSHALHGLVHLRHLLLQPQHLLLVERAAGRVLSPERGSRRQRDADGHGDRHDPMLAEHFVLLLSPGSTRSRG
jgi:hypothetical protein